jgi:GNAT superfamily N-acetyltransferase
VKVDRIDPDDDAAFDSWYDILRATDEERFPDVAGWSRHEARTMARLTEAATLYDCLVARDESGSVIGIGLLEVPQRDNLHRASLDVRVPRDRRRHGIGSAIVADLERRAAAAGRRMLGGYCEVPTAQLDTDASAPFARRLGFDAAQMANRRNLSLPIDPERLAGLKEMAARASVGYRIITFTAPWPHEFLEDECELGRRMSTDAPSPDEEKEEEVWDAARVKEMDDLLAEQGMTKLAAVAQHTGSGRLVGFSELAISGDHPYEAWQWATLVLREHRGHRLGLALKLANLDNVAAACPEARLIITGNAQENAPMIAVNEMMGFEVVATTTFWRKDLVP